MQLLKLLTKFILKVIFVAILHEIVSVLIQEIVLSTALIFCLFGVKSL